MERFSKLLCGSKPFVEKPWATISMRCIEPITYSIVDMAHPLQNHQTDTIHDKKAILDTIPYSRVFYHAFPGAIIMHRGKSYKVKSMSPPPPVVGTSFIYGRGRNFEKLAAFVQPTTVQYFTRALRMTKITVVKRLECVDLDVACLKRAQHTKENSDGLGKDSAKNMDIHDTTPKLTTGSIAGNGVVNVKQTVWGYAKLSPVTRAILSQTEITMPPMEFDTNALWLDAEAAALRLIIPNFDEGMHALSHAILAVAPLFVPCAMTDVDCDHSFVNCTRITLYDTRAGGSGTCAQLWAHFFYSDGIFKSAIDILENCSSCSSRDNEMYDGGCPGCLQSCPCTNFNQGLSRTAALTVAKRMQMRLQLSSSFVHLGESTSRASPPEKASSPREKVLRNANDLVRAQKRHIVVGRPSWPMDHNNQGNTLDDYHPVNESFSGSRGFIVD